MSYGVQAWSAWGALMGRGFGLRAIAVKSPNIQTSWGYNWNPGYNVVRHDIWMGLDEDIWYYMPNDGNARNYCTIEEEVNSTSRRASIIGSNPLQYVITTRRGVVWYGGNKTHGMRVFAENGECTYDSRCPILTFNAFTRRYAATPNNNEDTNIRNTIAATHGVNWNFMKQSNMGSTKIPYINTQPGGEVQLGAGRLADGRATMGQVTFRPRGGGQLLPIWQPALTTAMITEFSE